VPDIEQRVALAIVAKSPIARLKSLQAGTRLAPSSVLFISRQQLQPRLLRGAAGHEDTAAYNVFVRRSGAIHHFYGAEMTGETADPGQDRAGAPDFAPIWGLLDTTPEGRGKDWYPKLQY